MQPAKPKRKYTRKAKPSIVEAFEKVAKPSSPKKHRKNEEYAKLLGELLTIMTKRGDTIRARVYRRAQESILSIPEDIHGPGDLAGKPGIGPTILEKLQIYDKTGTLNILEREKDNPENILSDVYGVGPKKAKELVEKGITTIAQLRERQSEVLNEVQKVGLKYYEDILEKIPRAEIDEYAKVFQSVYEKISETTEMKYEIVGSYRRGVAFSGDIDVIITAKNAAAFKEWINALIAQKNIIEVLSRGASKCLVISRLGEEGSRARRARRVDFLYTTPEEYPFAVLYFTGSKGFNATMRGHALKRGLSLNEHGLSKMVDKKKEEKLSLNIVDERGIFDYLGLVYKEPKSRVDGRAVVSKDGAAVVPVIARTHEVGTTESVRDLSGDGLSSKDKDNDNDEVDIGEPGAEIPDIPKDPEKLEEFCKDLLQKKGKTVSSKNTLKKESIRELPKGPSIKKSKPAFILRNSSVVSPEKLPIPTLIPSSGIATKLPPIKILPDSLKLNNVIELSGNDLPKSSPKTIPKESSIVNIEKGKKTRKPKTEKVAKEPKKNKSVKISKEPPIIIPTPNPNIPKVPSSPIQKIDYEKLSSPKGLSKSPAKESDKSPPTDIQIPEPKPPTKNKTVKLPKLPKEPKIKNPPKTKTQKQKPQETNIVDIPERGTSVGISSFSGETSNAFRRMKDISQPNIEMSKSPKSQETAKSNILQFKNNGITILENLSQEDLANMLTVANANYYNDKGGLMTDNEYDIVKEYIEKKYPTNAVIQQIGAPIADRVKNKVVLPYEMWSMDKIKPDSNALPGWMKKYGGPYVLSCKLDGVSGLYSTEGPTPKLYTRGDGKVGQDVSFLLPVLKLPQEKGIVVRGEFIIPKKVFAEKYAKSFANPRNLVSGIVNSKKTDEKASDLHFVAYEVIRPELKPSEQLAKLKATGFEVVQNEVRAELSNESLSEVLVDWRTNYMYEIDGVIVANDAIYPRISGNPEHAFAFKMVLSDQKAEVKVIDVLWSPSKDGFLKPRVRIEPVRLGGVSIEYATGYNAKFIEENMIGIGAIVEIIRSGDVIPKILKVIVPAEKAKMPAESYKWNETHVDVLLENAGENATVQEKNLTAFFTHLEVDGLKAGNIKKLMAAGFDTIPKILAMTKEDFAKVGYKTLADKYVENIREKVANAGVVDLMVASGVMGRGLGEKKIEPILEAQPDILVSKDDQSTKIAKVKAVRGIETKTATLFVENIPRFVEFLETIGQSAKLTGVGASPRARASADMELEVDTSNPLYGKKVVMSKIRDADIIRELKARGATLEDSIGSKTFVLIVGSLEDVSSKTKYAVSHGIPIMTPEQFKGKYLEDTKN